MSNFQECVLCGHAESEHEKESGFCSHGISGGTRGCECLEFVGPKNCKHCSCSLVYIGTSKTERLWKCLECNRNYGTPLATLTPGLFSVKITG